MCLPRRRPSVVSMQCPQSPHFIVHPFTVDQGTCVFSYWGRAPCSYNGWSLDVRQLCHTSPSPITFHDANAFYWSTAFKTPYTSAGSLAVDLLSEHMVALTCIETQHVHTDKFYVLFLNWSCQSRCSRRNQKERNTPLIFISITFAGFIYIYIHTQYGYWSKQYSGTCTSSLC